MCDYDRECVRCHKYLSIDDLYLETKVLGFYLPVCLECKNIDNSQSAGKYN